MQLVAYGAQDVYLTGNPQITFFKVVYRRHTNFSIEAMEQPFQGASGFGKKCTANIQRNADLIGATFLKVSVSGSGSCGKWAWVPRLGHALIDEVSVMIGGTQVDRQTGNFMNIYYELCSKHYESCGFDNMIGNTAHMTTLSDGDKNATLFIPLQFWFNRNPGLALPLIALQYHDVRVNVAFASKDSVYIRENCADVSVEIQDANLLIDYVYLDTAERKKFAVSAHEYLIEQVQSTDENLTDDRSRKVRLNFNHPSKFLAWVLYKTTLANT
jgi:hypothetical protein